MLLVIGILAGCNSTDVPAAPEKESNTADTSVDTDIGKTTAAEVDSNSAQITEKAPETAAESNIEHGSGGAVPDWYTEEYGVAYHTIPLNDLEKNAALINREYKQRRITEHGYTEKFDILPALIKDFNIPKENSVRSSPLKHCHHSLQQNHDVPRDRPVLNIRHIRILRLFLSQIAASGNLPRSSNTRLNQQSRGIQHVISRDFFRQRRARPNQAHIALEHVKELRELIQRCFTNKVTDLSHAWIVLELEDKTILNAAFLSQFRLDLVGISPHATELVHR